jgi:hypothetical protein
MSLLFVSCSSTQYCHPSLYSECSCDGLIFILRRKNYCNRVEEPGNICRTSSKHRHPKSNPPKRYSPTCMPIYAQRTATHTVTGNDWECEARFCYTDATYIAPKFIARMAIVRQ